MLKSYLKKLSDVAKTGDAREESYYSCLEGLFKAFAESIGKKKTHVTTLPKKTEAGNPDFRIWDGKQNIVGYIEAKNPTEENLDYIEDTEQLKRYLNTFPNLILTNFFEFRLYRNGQLRDNVLVARPFIIQKLKTIPPVEKEKEFFNLLNEFFAFSLPKTYSARSLAVELAKRTRFLKEQVIIEELKEEEEKGEGFILGFYQAFQKYLLGGLTREDFADLYSQTITYGLFAARTRFNPPIPPLVKGGEGGFYGFNRKLAYDNIPSTIGILRDVFEFISLGKLPPQMAWIIDDISEVLATADVNQILRKFYKEGKGSDPIIHFYETFLSEYDPKEREMRGVYYTPETVVSFIVRSLNIILKEHFGKDDGFASNSVTVLDPASGTLTFLAEASKLAVEDFVNKYGEGGKEKLIKEHILKNFYAFELMMAPYAVGHLKISFLLEELGYGLKEDDRFKLYLTNTLERAELEQTSLPGMSSLAEESHLAGQVKKETPILVILGNPPYSGISANLSEKEVIINNEEKYITSYQIKEVNGYHQLIPQTKKAKRQIKVRQKTWIGELIEHYKIIDGQWLKERNPKWLQDDYVKFIRFAQWKIDRAGEGILGFITNHSYLDNPTFRGMRQSLMNSFDEIYLLDLHGNTLKKERCPDGSKDENVFDIRQGVAIAVCIKKKNKEKEGRVYHQDVWGLREFKYDWLSDNDIKTTGWKKLSPRSGFYLFIPRDERLLEGYERYPKITDIFLVNSVGIVTARDSFAIDFDKEKLKRRIMIFRDKKMPDELIRQTFSLKDKSNWKLKDARENLIKDENWKESIIKILYRPFDIRWILYHDEVIERSRKEVMSHMMRENLGLISVRQVAENVFNHIFITDNIIESRVTLSNKGIAFLFPLYLYNNPDPPKKRKGPGITMMLFEPTAPYTARRPNLNEGIIKKLLKSYKKQVAPEEILYYIYAVLYSNIYRTKYVEFLRIDFPRVPFTKDHKLFIKMGDLGKRLVDLHLMKSSEFKYPAARFQGKGDYRIKKRKYDEEENRVYINNEQYFEGIEKALWAYQIGGYQVLDKWLKDRKGRVLSLDDVRHYCRIATALKNTIKIQEGIDNIYPDIEVKCVEFNDEEE